MNILQVLLAGLIGALLVFVLGVIREEWRNDRERRGVLRLLLAEIRHNAGVMRRTREESRLEQIGSMKLSHMKTETWRATQARAMQLVPGELLRCLEDYYIPLETLLTRLKHEDSVEDAGERWWAVVLEERFGGKASQHPSGEYAMRTLDVQEEVQKRIKEYLARSWFDRFRTRALQYLANLLAWGRRNRDVR